MALRKSWATNKGKSGVSMSQYEPMVKFDKVFVTGVEILLKFSHCLCCFGSLNAKVRTPRLVGGGRANQSTQKIVRGKAVTARHIQASASCISGTDFAPVRPNLPVARSDERIQWSSITFVSDSLRVQCHAGRNAWVIPHRITMMQKRI